MEVSRGICCTVAMVTLLIGFSIGVLIGIYAFPNDEENDATHCRENKLANDAFEAKPSYTKALVDFIDAQGIADHLTHLTKEPHVAGTDESKEVADYIADVWVKQGLQSVKTSSYHVMLSYPGSNHQNSIELLTTRDSRDDLFPTLPREQDKPFLNKKFPDAYHAFSPAGVVTGDLVYANYGSETDFDQLENWNISVEGKIVIARYGLIFRGNKVDNAAKRGAVGVLLYTDPEEVAPEGINGTKVYNHTRWLPGDGLQRGTVYEKIGDPLTPGLPSISNVARIDVSDADLPSIPSQPLGYFTAKELLSRMAGREAHEENWVGGLKIPYRTGPGFEGKYSNDVVRMNIYNEFRGVDIFNVIGIIPGAIEPDRYVIVGNSHDAWGYGFVNPSSGTAQLLEITDAFTKLYKMGWRPRRTIIFCAWDAGKFGQIGSTEWVEEHLAELSARTIVYINCESCVETEDIRVSASPILRQAVIDVSRLVRAPEDNDKVTGESIFDEWIEREDDDDADFSKENKPDDQDLDGDTSDDDDDIVITPLGAESDHAAFAFYAGIPSIDVHADDEGTVNFFPTQNTAYDVRDYLDKFVDPGHRRSVSCARYVAVLVRYLADKELLPYDIDRLGALLEFTLNDIKDHDIHKILAAGNVTLFRDLELAVEEFKRATETFNAKLDQVKSGDPISTRVVNDQMMFLERAFIKPIAEKDDWFHRHLLFGPSDLDKYSDSIFPHLTDLQLKIDEIREEEIEEALDMDEDEGKEGDIDIKEVWANVEHYMSNLLVAVKMATNFLKPFPAAYNNKIF